MSGPIADCRGTGVVALLYAASAVESFFDAKLGEVGLSLPKLAALDRLMQAGGSLPLGQLAERLACVRSNVTQLVDRLDADGLVTREPDPNDRRSRLAVITKAGRRAHERGSAARREAERHLFSALSPAEASQLTEIVAKLEHIVVGR
jgi:DNA-binding MarR family transcriptional regulator